MGSKNKNYGYFSDILHLNYSPVLVQTRPVQVNMYQEMDRKKNLYHFIFKKILHDVYRELRAGVLHKRKTILFRQILTQEEEYQHGEKGNNC